jgi:hypothetical protein
MPFKSSSQRKFMYAKKPKLAKEFEEETPKDKKLPKKASGSKKIRSPKRDRNRSY